MLKRLIDFTAALLGLVLLSPFMLVLYLLVRFSMGKPAFFIQRRPGLNGKPFRMIKFRTLTNETDAEGQLLPENERLTKLGALMRKTSLDELPELCNVLVGQMSLVGPRPLRMYYMPLYNDEQAKRHNVRPGITGWAQVNGRNELNWEDRFKLDVWYVENQSFWLDIKILLITFIKVFKRESTTASDGGFTEPFMGTDTKQVTRERVQQLKQKEEMR